MKLQREEESGRKRQVHDCLVAVLVTVSMQAAFITMTRTHRQRQTLACNRRRCCAAGPWLFYEEVSVFIRAPLNVTILVTHGSCSDPDEASGEKSGQIATAIPPPHLLLSVLLFSICAILTVFLWKQKKAHKPRHHRRPISPPSSTAPSPCTSLSSRLTATVAAQLRG